MSKHGETERQIINKFKSASIFTFENANYKILKIGKPKPSKGECKTDVYILAKNTSTNAIREFKISNELPRGRAVGVSQTTKI